MGAPRPKTLEDFPNITVTAVRPGAKSDAGYQWFEMVGNYDPILEKVFERITAGTGPQWFWLMYGDRGYLCPTLKSFDVQTSTATLTCQGNEEPKILGRKLAYVSPAWQACHIWMVHDPKWGWERRRFQAGDAIAEDYESEEVTIVNGREVKKWTKLEPAGESGGQPVGPGTRLVPGGWDHEHCELCNEHIESGEIGYCDTEGRWICHNCYERYVARHDLAFVDEL